MRIRTTPYLVGMSAVDYARAKGAALYRAAMEGRPFECITPADGVEWVANHGPNSVYCGGIGSLPELEAEINVTLSLRDLMTIRCALDTHAQKLEKRARLAEASAYEIPTNIDDSAEFLKEHDILMRLARHSTQLLRELTKASEQ